MITEKLLSKFNWLKPYYFTYKNGFYHLPCSVESPQNLVASFANYPFVKHSKEKQCVSSNNPFCEGGFYYQKLEEGCWIVYAKMRYKTNVAYDLLYDVPNDAPLTDDDYYMLSLNSISNPVRINKKISERQLCFPQYSWTLFKPKERVCDLNFKGANNKYITLYFNQAWLENNLLPNRLFTEAGLDRFIKSDKSNIVWSLPENDAALANFDIFNKAMNIGGDASRIDFLNLKLCTLNLIFEYLRLCKEADIVNTHVPIDYNDKFGMSKVGHYLDGHLCDKFPGIDFLAKKFKISETKLKTEFRQLFGKPIYRYFRDRQMELAKEVLTENQLLIKELAYKFGYESVSKFSAAFRKYHGALPSKLNEAILAEEAVY